MKRNPIFFRLNYSFQKNIELNADELEHLRSLRLDKDEKLVEYRDGRGSSYIYEVGYKKKNGELREKIVNSIEMKDFPIASALPKAQKLDFVLQKCTEIGVTKFHFIILFQSDRKELNETRAGKILQSAAAQSGRHTIPEISVYNSLEEFLNFQSNVFYLHPYAEKSIANLKAFTYIPVIGPEGGFREEEIKLFTEKNLEGYTFGKNILRLETAVLSIASILQYERIRMEYD